MDETPDQPRPPAEDGRNPQSSPAGPPSEDPPDSHPPSGGDAWPPLADAEEAPRRRSWSSRGRLAAAGVAVLVLLGAGLAVGLGGGGTDGGTDGVASVDGTEGDVETGDDSEGSGSSGRPDPSEMQDAMLEYVDCMREHGVDMPDPEFGEGGRVIMEGPRLGEGDADDFEAANEACQPILDEAAPDLNLSPEEIAERQDQALAMAECMREKGYDFPDPIVDEDGGIQIRLGDEGSEEGSLPGPDDEQFQQDQQECSEESGLPGPGGGGSGGSSDSDEGSA